MMSKSNRNATLTFFFEKIPTTTASFVSRVKLKNDAATIQERMNICKGGLKRTAEHPILAVVLFCETELLRVERTKMS